MFTIIFSILASIAIFLFAITKFSNQVQRLAGDKLKEAIYKITKTPILGVVTGSVVTGIVQSSTAVTVMLVGLAQAGLISFHNSLGVIFGANIGTAITSQLIAFRILDIAPLIVILGFLLNILPGRYKPYGKPIFYFGLLFFSLFLISTLVEPLRNNEVLLNLLNQISSVGIAILAGFLITLIFQSSTITSGLAIVLVGGQFLDFYQAFGIILGANIGTTSTAVLTSLFMGYSAKRVALAHFLFNFLGLLIFLPFLEGFSSWITSVLNNPQMQVAAGHAIFNVFSAGVFLIFIKPFSRLVQYLIPSEIAKNKNQ